MFKVKTEFLKNCISFFVSYIMLRLATRVLIVAMTFSDECNEGSVNMDVE